MKFPAEPKARVSSAIQAEENLRQQRHLRLLRNSIRRRRDEQRYNDTALQTPPILRSRTTKKNTEVLSPLHDRHVDNLSFQVLGREAYLEHLHHQSSRHQSSRHQSSAPTLTSADGGGGGGGGGV